MNLQVVEFIRERLGGVSLGYGLRAQLLAERGDLLQHELLLQHGLPLAVQALLQHLTHTHTDTALILLLAQAERDIRGRNLDLGRELL